MARFVIAGAANCPLYAQTEAVANHLSTNLPNFHVHKIVKDVWQWQPWLKNVCKENGWKHEKSPLVWREIVNRGGKGQYIGGSREFMEYVHEYYGFQKIMPTPKLRLIAAENVKAVQQEEEQAAAEAMKQNPDHFCITEGGSPVTYHLVPELLRRHELFSPDGVALHVHPNMVNKASEMGIVGIAMEAQDLAFQSMRDYMIARRIEECFQGCSLVFILDDLTQRMDEKEKGWMRRVDHVMRTYGSAIKNYAKPKCRVIMAGEGPMCFAAKSLIFYADTALEKGNVVVVTGSVLQNVACNIVAEKFKVHPTDVKEVYVWGVEGRYRIDLHHTRLSHTQGAVIGPNGYSRPLEEFLVESDWPETVSELVEKRMAAKAEIRSDLGAMTKMAAIIRVLEMWYGPPPGPDSPKVDISLGICADGTFDIPEGWFVIQPTALRDGKFVPNSEVELSDDSKKNLGVFLENIGGTMREFLEETIDQLLEVLSVTTRSFDVMEIDDITDGDQIQTELHAMRSSPF